ncbi:MAG: hypothetical protein HFJ04_04300 [Lachnospiraceae bacterium]|nr:hypothetical protein [Lachnospiraceae bacterium]
MEKWKKRIYLVIATIVIGEFLGFFLSAIFRLPLKGGIGTIILLLLGFSLAEASWHLLPVIRDWLCGGVREGGLRDVQGEGFGIKQAAFLIAAAAFFYYNIKDAYLTFANWYINRNNNVKGITHNFHDLSISGAMHVAVVSIILTLFLWNRFHRSAFFQSCAAIAALVLAAGAVWAFLGLGQAGVTSSELAEGILTEEALSKITPISFPDLTVLRWAAPSVVLSYYGWDSVGQRAAKWGRRIAISCVALSVTPVCTILRVAVWKAI